jgi:hypothetical protein
MDWKTRLEKNAFWVVVGACVATGSTVASIMEYYSSQKIEIIKQQQNSDVSELKTQLASISRNIGHEEYLDVRKIVVSRDRVSPSPNSRYFDDAEFYAPAATGDWAYSQTSEAALAQALLGVDIAESSLIKKAGNLAPIHLWRTKETLNVQGSSLFKNLFSYVYLERMPVETFKSAVGSLASNNEPPRATPESKESTHRMSGDPMLDSLFRGDIAGKLLTFVLASQLAIGDEVSCELLNVQKIHNVVYLAMRYTLKDVQVQRTAYPRYYLYSEVVIISDGPNATMIKTLVPSPDPSGNTDYFRYLTSWFNDLRVLVG